MPGLGGIGGFKLQVQDRTGAGYPALYAATQKLIAAAQQRPELTGIFSNFQINAPRCACSRPATPMASSCR